MITIVMLSVGIPARSRFLHEPGELTGAGPRTSPKPVSTSTRSVGVSTTSKLLVNCGAG